MDEVSPLVALDLLQEWTASALRRSVGKVDPAGCSWGTFAVAFQQAGGCLNQHEAEVTLRRHLVDSYMHQTDMGLDDILAAKLALGGQFSQIVGDQSLESARARWPWYLYCLTVPTHESSDFWAIVRVDLDLVDLQILSLRLCMHVTVWHLTEQPEYLQPHSVQHTLHVVHHRGRWAPLLDVRPLESEAFPPLGSVVELVGGLALQNGWDEPGILDDCDGPRSGAVLSYDRDKDVYNISLGQHNVLVQRDHISRLIYHQSSDTLHEASDRHDDLFCQDDNSPLSGVPDGAFEWQLLHELVRREARAKLERMMQQLAGRDVADKVAHVPLRGKERGTIDRSLEKESTSIPHQSGLWTRLPQAEPDPTLRPHQFPDNTSSTQQHASGNKQDAGKEMLYMRLPFDFFEDYVGRGSEISIFTVRRHMCEEAGQLALAVGDEVRVRQLNGDWVLGAAGVTDSFPGQGACREGWCSRDVFTLWEACREFRPSGHAESDHDFLLLDRGDTVVVTCRYSGEWDGWGFGERWGAKKGNGFVHLGYMEPRVIVSRCQWMSGQF